jgi:hypothetical protein
MQVGTRLIEVDHPRASASQDRIIHVCSCDSPFGRSRGNNIVGNTMALKTQPDLGMSVMSPRSRDENDEAGGL